METTQHAAWQVIKAANDILGTTFLSHASASRTKLSHFLRAGPFPQELSGALRGHKIETEMQNL